MERWDAIVVGGGVMGTAAAWHLARRGRRTLLLERFEVGHGNGSSHGPTRIVRLSYHHPEYVRMARRSYDSWDEIQDAAGERLVHTTGGLDTGPGARRNAEAMAAAGVQAEWLTPQEAEERWTALRVPRGADLLFQPDAGVVMASRVVAAQARLAVEAGATLAEGTVAERLSPSGEGVEVRVDSGQTHAAPVAVVTAGAWAGPLLAAAGVDLPLRPTQEQVHYLDEATRGSLPSLIGWSLPPAPPSYLVPDPTRLGTVKVAEHVAGAEVTPESRTFEADPTRRDRALAFARRWLREPGEARGDETCLYTNTPDEDFVIDRVGPLVIGSPCSGHGFKFAPLIGHVLADLATGAPPPDEVPLARFSAARFGST